MTGSENKEQRTTSSLGANRLSCPFSVPRLRLTLFYVFWHLDSEDFNCKDGKFAIQLLLTNQMFKQLELFYISI